MFENFDWRKTIFRIFFLYQYAIVGCTSVAEEYDDIFYLSSFGTVITDLEQVISFGDERFSSPIFIEQCRESGIECRDMITTCSTDIESESHPYIPIVTSSCTDWSFSRSSLYARWSDAHILDSDEEIFQR